MHFDNPWSLTQAALGSALETGDRTGDDRVLGVLHAGHVARIILGIIPTEAGVAFGHVHFEGAQDPEGLRMELHRDG